MSQTMDALPVNKQQMPINGWSLLRSVDTNAAIPPPLLKSGPPTLPTTAAPTVPSTPLSHTDAHQKQPVMTPLYYQTPASLPSSASTWTTTQQQAYLAEQAMLQQLQMMHPQLQPSQIQQLYALQMQHQQQLYQAELAAQQARSAGPSHPSSSSHRRKSMHEAELGPDGKKKRTRTSAEQLRYLQRHFAHDPMPSAATRNAIAEKLGMPPRAIQVWFQNKRAKSKQERKRQGDETNPSFGDSNPMGLLPDDEDDWNLEQQQQQQQQDEIQQLRLMRNCSNMPSLVPSLSGALSSSSSVVDELLLDGLQQGLLPLSSCTAPCIAPSAVMPSPHRSLPVTTANATPARRRSSVQGSVPAAQTRLPTTTTSPRRSSSGDAGIVYQPQPLHPFMSDETGLSDEPPVDLTKDATSLLLMQARHQLLLEQHQQQQLSDETTNLSRSLSRTSLGSNAGLGLGILPNPSSLPWNAAAAMEEKQADMDLNLVQDEFETSPSVEEVQAMFVRDDMLEDDNDLDSSFCTANSVSLDSAAVAAQRHNRFNASLMWRRQHSWRDHSQQRQQESIAERLASNAVASAVASNSPPQEWLRRSFSTPDVHAFLSVDQLRALQLMGREMMSHEAPIRVSPIPFSQTSGSSTPRRHSVCVTPALNSSVHAAPSLLAPRMAGIDEEMGWLERADTPSRLLNQQHENDSIHHWDDLDGVVLMESSN